MTRRRIAGCKGGDDTRAADVDVAAPQLDAFQHRSLGRPLGSDRVAMRIAVVEHDPVDVFAEAQQRRRAIGLGRTGTADLQAGVDVPGSRQVKTTWTDVEHRRAGKTGPDRARLDDIVGRFEGRQVVGREVARRPEPLQLDRPVEPSDPRPAGTARRACRGDVDGLARIGRHHRCQICSVEYEQTFAALRRQRRCGAIGRRERGQFGQARNRRPAASATARAAALLDLREPLRGGDQGNGLGPAGETGQASVDRLAGDAPVGQQCPATDLALVGLLDALHAIIELLTDGQRRPDAGKAADRRSKRDRAGPASARQVAHQVDEFGCERHV